MRRLGLTRADLIGLLIEKYADTVTTHTDAHKRLKDAVEALGGTLTFEAWNGPLGGRWVLTLGGKSKSFQMESKKCQALDACYVGVTRPRDGHVAEIDPAGLAELLRLLATSCDRETE